MTHFLTFPDKATWEAFEWKTDGQYAEGPQGQFADIIGPNYYQAEDGTREPRPGFLVNVAGTLPETMRQYAMANPPQHPKRVFA